MGSTDASARIGPRSVVNDANRRPDVEVGGLSFRLRLKRHVRDANIVAVGL